MEPDEQHETDDALDRKIFKMYFSMGYDRAISEIGAEARAIAHEYHNKYMSSTPDQHLLRAQCDGACKSMGEIIANLVEKFTVENHARVWDSINKDHR